ncbi:MAG: hypothetical protein ACXAD7_07235, partial [Candidatus Kariarchaeaceae archaeon]
MPHNDVFLKAYQNARTVIDDILGQTPENYKVLQFLDPTLYDSVILQTTFAGSPRAIISSNELDIL